MDHPDEANDNELSDLLESTLGDFFKSSASSSSTLNATSSSSSTGRTFGQLPNGTSPFDQFTKKHLDKFGKEGKNTHGDSEEDQSDTDENDAEKVKQKLDELLNDFIEKEPQLREHWQKLSESYQLPAGSEEAFDTLNETMKSLSESAKSINSDGDISEEELSRLWNKLGISGEGQGDQNEEGVVPEVFSLVTNLMQNLLSKQVLYPSIKDLSERYPGWIDEHRNELDEGDLERYTKQFNLMKQVCVEFEAENESDPSEVKDSRFQKILKIMQDMKDCGSPPKELVGDVPDIGSDLDFSKLSEMAGGMGGGPSEQGCSMM
ncbi:peroxisomal biogenesis factor 19-like [Panonychus citri]|uniref:peroxisomal biogenesis factor 19-like n=1 Tax=Panonychus citri TaxID=50023 RepID=UPI002307DAEE|nr:peroxisomal biogenesis factor 19-like [Panonychus citri]XP_053210503.1 peroxisomal biogenesis factor 19-like [Panonychus citri]XP_053210504.1 peroxisomal biogenesis factor 19-like [Panonychus citri]XP_053210505.1 peroxisomal biogenesis factor 19-like [Panonychus citri]